MKHLFAAVSLSVLLVLGTAFAQNSAPAQTEPVYNPPAQGVAAGSSLELPAGSQIEVRTIDAIDAQTADEGRTYAASINRDITGPSGTVLVPKGSDAQLVVRTSSGGGVTGSPELTLDLQSITVNGSRYQVSTTDLQEKSDRGIGKNRRTATMVGGGAALGTLLGAIAGGGKGALIGAVAGAAAGGTAQVLTKGKQVKVPSESVLKFQLDQPLLLESSRR